MYHNLAKIGNKGAFVSHVGRAVPALPSLHTPHFFLILLKGLFLSFNKDLEAAEAETEGWSRSNTLLSGTPWDPECPLVQKGALRPDAVPPSVI